MTKKNVLKVIDRIFWLLIAIFPLICYALYCINIPANVNTTDYMYLDYIENTAKIDFNTGYYASQVSKFDMTYQIVGNSSGTLFGGEASGIGVQLTGTYNATSRFGPWLTSSTPSNWKFDSDKHHIVWDKYYMYQDDTLINSPSQPVTDFTSYNATRIWGRGSSNPDLSVARFRLYDFKIYNNDVLVRDYIPVMRANDRQVGLFEKVTGEFTPLFENIVVGDIISDSANAGNLPSLDFVMQKIGICINDTNVIYKGLADIFGSNGVIPLIYNNSILYYVSWLFMVELLHIFVDFLLFIPRWLHKFLEKGVE